MSKKNNQIISILAKEKRSITSDELSRKLNVSSRTIKRTIWDIDEILKENGAKIISNKSGYQLEVFNNKEFKNFLKGQKRLSKDLRIDNEIVLHILELLFVNEYITQDELSFNLYISRSSLNKYIKHVKSVLEKEKIILSNRPHYGYYLLGQETTIRNYMVKLFFGNDDLKHLKNHILVNNCRDYVEFYENIINLLYEYGYDVNNNKTQSLIKYFIVLANRYYHHHYIEKYNNEILIADSSEELPLKIKKLLSDYFYVSINEEELIYLTYLMDNPIKKNNNQYDVMFFEEIIDDCFKEILDIYQQDFSYDDVLRKGLVQHLYTSYSRMYINAVINNPIINMIKTQYVEAYNYAVSCGAILSKKYHLELNEDNLGYIAMHFAAAIERNNALYRFKVIVVCESGFGMAELLTTRLKNRIQNIDIVAVTSVKNLLKMNLNDIVLIISSIPIEDKIEIPVVIINPLLLENDIEEINEYLSYYRDMDEYKKIFHKNLFFTNIKAENKKDLLEQLCCQLIEKNCILENDKKEIIHREKISSTEINDLVAIPHCILDAKKKTVFTIAVLDEEIDWGKGKVQLVFLGGIGRNDHFNKKIFPLLYKLTMNAEKVKRLCSIKDFEEFISELFKHIPIEYD